MPEQQPDLSEFHKLSKPRKPPCEIGLILSRELGPKLADDEVEQLRAALASDRGVITSGAIQAWLYQRAHEVTVNRVATHRRGVCTCGKA